MNRAGVMAENKRLKAEVASLNAQLASARTASIGILRSFSGFNLALATTLDDATTLLSQQLARYRALTDEGESRL